MVSKLGASLQSHITMSAKNRCEQYRSACFQGQSNQLLLQLSSPLEKFVAADETTNDSSDMHDYEEHVKIQGE